MLHPDPINISALDCSAVDLEIVPVGKWKRFVRRRSRSAFRLPRRRCQGIQRSRFKRVSEVRMIGRNVGDMLKRASLICLPNMDGVVRQSACQCERDWLRNLGIHRFKNHAPVFPVGGFQSDVASSLRQMARRFVQIFPAGFGKLSGVCGHPDGALHVIVA